MIKKLFKLIYFLLFSFSIFGVSLSEIEGLKNLSNYNELKNKQTIKILEGKDKGERRKGIGYEKGASEPFTGVLVSRNQNKIIDGIFFYRNGRLNGDWYEYYENGQLYLKLKSIDDKSEGRGWEYYENGKLKSDSVYKNDILENRTEYYEKTGKVKYILKATDGVNAVLTSYYESGIKSGEKEIIQDYSQAGKVNYVANGKALVYDKKGNLFGELQLRNNSTVGQKQKFYENNRLKYEFIAGSELNEPAKPSQYYIEYYDNSDKVAMHCEEKPNGSWTCKEYKKDGTFKREKEYPTVIYKQRGTKDWINYLLPVLKVFGL